MAAKIHRPSIRIRPAVTVTLLEDLIPDAVDDEVDIHCNGSRSYIDVLT